MNTAKVWYNFYKADRNIIFMTQVRSLVNFRNSKPNKICLGYVIGINITGISIHLSVCDQKRGHEMSTGLPQLETRR